MLRLKRQSARNYALRLLARREYARNTLATCLVNKGFFEHDIDETLASLIAENLQSDARFAEQYVYTRQRLGYGPFRIAAELAAYGVVASLIDQYVNVNDPAWKSHQKRALDKKFGRAAFSSQHSELQQRRSHFLYQRGFCSEEM